MTDLVLPRFACIEIVLVNALLDFPTAEMHQLYITSIDQRKRYLVSRVESNNGIGEHLYTPTHRPHGK